MRISDWSSDVCSSDLGLRILRAAGRQGADGQCKREGEGNLLQLHGNLLGSVGSELVRQSNVYVAVDAFPGAGRMLELAALAHPGLHRCLGQELPLVPDLGGAVVGAVVGRKQPAGIGAADRHADVMLRSEEHTSELQSLIRISYAVFCLETKT